MPKEITIDDLAQMVAKGFDGVDENFGKVYERFEKVDEKFEKIDERFEKIEDILERMDREMVKKYDLEYLLSKHDKRITHLEESLNK
jgi:DNA anti-recombination protein RmuC